MAQTHTMLEEALHTLDYALLIVDDKARIGFKNREAARLLQASPSLRESDEGRLTARPSSVSAELHKAIRAACLNSPPAGLRIPPAAVPFWLGLIFTPLAGHAAVWIIDGSAVASGSERLLASLFRLSPAEARLALALLGGQSAEDYCRRARIAIATARSQLHSIFAKTGTRRQAALVALLSRIPALNHSVDARARGAPYSLAT